jgi:hypothetical protein
MLTLRLTIGKRILALSFTISFLNILIFYRYMSAKYKLTENPPASAKNGIQNLHARIVPSRTAQLTTWLQRFPLYPPFHRAT